MKIDNCVEVKPSVRNSLLDELARLASFCKQDMNQVAACSAILYGVLNKKAIEKKINLI